MYIQHLIWPPLAAIKVFTRGGILEMYSFENCSVQGLWCQTCIIRSIKTAFVVQTIPDLLFIISFQRNWIGTCFMFGLLSRQSRISKYLEIIRSFILFVGDKKQNHARIYHRCWSILSFDVEGNIVAHSFNNVGTHFFENYDVYRDDCPYHILCYVLETFEQKLFIQFSLNEDGPVLHFPTVD